ncbi:MAG TPA: hypothetical protein PK971_07150 [Saprospiraceae bacterium]|nr:hypothetical protein [Saprospiraceae bacterium]
MKKIGISLLLCLCAALAASAQNWAPVSTTGDMHHYRLPGSTHITHTIRLDSTVSAPNMPVVLYLNRVWRRWTELDSHYVWINQGQFLGQHILLHPDGRWVFVARNGLQDSSFTVIPKAALGQKWPVLPGSSHTAEVVSVGTGNVLGQPDSLKVIRFSQGAEWVLSKNYGLVSCPDPHSGGQTVQLSGIQSKQLGDRLYDFADFFTYAVGDVFEVVDNNINFLGSQSEHSKRTVIEVLPLPNGVAYRYDRQGSYSSNGFGGNQQWKRRDTITQYHLYENFLHGNAYHHQVAELAMWGQHLLPITLESGGLWVGDDAVSDCAAYLPLEASDHWSGLSENLLACEGSKPYGLHLRKPVGVVLETADIVDYYQFYVLIGAVMSGDTVWGQITPDWVFTSTHAPTLHSESLRIVPNPATTEARLQVPESVSQQSVQIQLLSLDGRLLQEHNVIDQEGWIHIDLSGLAPQPYLLTLRTDAGIWHGRGVIAGR